MRRSLLALAVLVLGACADGAADSRGGGEPDYPACQTDDDCDGGICIVDEGTVYDGEDSGSRTTTNSVCSALCMTTADCPGSTVCGELYGELRCIHPCEAGCPEGLGCGYAGGELCMWPQ